MLFVCRFVDVDHESILTNNGAMVALQTLRSINSNLESTQNAIATGKDVATSKDNAAVWAISKVMDSDVAGFKAISDNLGLGQATTQVAREAAETTTDLLQQMKEKIVASQEQNVDRAKIQTDIEALRDQIGSVTGAAQFNGLNLLNNTETGGTAIADIVANVGSGETNVLSSLDRSGTGVAAANITVEKQDLGTGSLTFAAGTDIAATAIAGAGAVNDGASQTLTIAGDTATAARDGNAVLAGDSYRITGLTTGDVEYVARDGDTVEDIATALGARLSFQAESEGLSGLAVSVDGDEINIINNTGGNLTSASAVNTGGTAGGGLELLSQIDVTTDEGAAAALTAIEGLVQTSIDSAASFGSSQNRIETQQNFVSSLMDAMKSGIGTLVDADMEAESARLQALQVQQQLGVQALSIANQAPQQLLSLFR